jgi:rhamnose utilization protein RhaD (predicted bifunctional aldolase and dehydrogenase)
MVTSRQLDEGSTRDAAAGLLALCAFLGSPERDLAILGEGNVSCRVDDDSMLVKASGASLGAMGDGDLTEVRLSVLLELVASGGEVDDAEVASALVRSQRHSTAKRPSVEALLHAVCLDAGASAVGHTHPVSVNAVLCSDRASALVEGALFPDQIVVLGHRQLLVPYVDPGVALARHVAVMLGEFVAAEGVLPKVIYLVNHGMFALGDSTDEVQRITVMADKVARVLLSALAVGAPRYLTAADARRIDTRPDELLRRQALAARTPSAQKELTS